MKVICLREIQLMELAILKDFDAFCRKNKLVYTLTAGSLLGAVRHKGFIPWDDDIDIYMPRPDYDKFNKIYDSLYTIKSTFVDSHWPYPFTKLINNKISIREKSSNILSGLWIDIFPVDGWPDSYTNSLSYRNRLLRLKTLNSCSYLKYVKSPHGSFRTLAKFMLISTIGRIPKGVIARYIDSIASTTYKYEKSEFIGNVVFHDPDKLVRIQKDFFEDRILWPFEDSEFYIPRNYDSYLKQAYGDYMKLPPESERQSHPMEFL